MTENLMSDETTILHGGVTVRPRAQRAPGTLASGIFFIALLCVVSGRPAVAQSCSTAPGDVIDLQFAADGMTMTFTEPLMTGGGVPYFDMLRADGMAQFASTAVCVESNELDNAAVDGANPALGQMFVYIPRAENDCGLGVMGFDDAGVERPQGIQCGLCLTDATCDDGLYCTGNEICDAAGGACRPGTPPACAPFACDEGAAACVMSCVDDGGCVTGFGCHQGSCVEAIDVTVMDDGRDADPDDGVCDTGSRECTLRAAIQEANARAGLQIVRLQKGAYLLTLNGMSDDEGLSGDFDLLDDVIVRGVDSARTWVDGQTVDRVFHVHPGVDATLQNLTLQQGRAMGANGGGVLNEGILQLESAMVNACSTDGRGGGIFNAPLATLTLNGSTVAFNNAGDDGGGVANDGDMTAMISTLSSNTAGDRGGALQVGPRAWAELINVTVYNNTAATGGGLDPGAGTLQMVNTVVAGSIMGGDCAAPPLSLGHNLAGDLSCDLTQTGDVQETDPRLADLLVYTDSGIRTHYPLEPSPTQGTGDPTFIPPLDQNHQNWTAVGSTFKGGVVGLPLIEALRSGRLYASGHNEIMIFDTLAHQLVGTIPNWVGGITFLMSPSGQLMYSWNITGGSHLEIIDLDTNTITPSVYIPELLDIELHPSGTRLFVTRLGVDHIYLDVLDTTTMQTVQTINVPTPFNSNVGVDSTGSTLLTTLPSGPFCTDPVYAFEAYSPFALKWLHSWPATWCPWSVYAGPPGSFFTADRHLNNYPDFDDFDSRLSYLQSFSSPPVTVIDLGDQRVGEVVSNASGSRLYVGTSVLGSSIDVLLIVDTNPGQIVTTVPNVGLSLELHPLGGALYAGGSGAGVKVISTTTFAAATIYEYLGSHLALKP